MSTKKSPPSKKAAKKSPRITSPASVNNHISPAVIPESRGKQEYLLTIREGAEGDAINAFANFAGLASIHSTAGMSADEIAAESAANEADGIIFSRVGLASVYLDADQVAALRKVNGTVFEAIEVAPIFYALADLSFDYLRGWSDCAAALVGSIITPPTKTHQEFNQTKSSGNTWGIEVTKTSLSSFSGKGIRVAVLDTGIDLRHPDFAGREIIQADFIDNLTVQDRHGHGTHCAGTACGPLRPQTGVRYGIAWAADLHIGKVLSDSGGSRGNSVASGMEWALAKQCHIISMSLGSPVLPDAIPVRAYERLGQRALQAGSLIIAAAGNDSERRRGIINPVSSPANCPSIYAVGAIDAGLQVASFSNGGITAAGGSVDIVAPGVDIESAAMGGGTRKMSGTSMATPHVAGVAALLAEASGKRGRELWNLLDTNAKSLNLDSRDVGRGLVQASS